MKVSDRRKFEKANFDEFESALNNKNDLVHCPSITLFESIPTEVLVILRRRKVWSNQSGKIQNWCNG
ncbi:AIG_G0039240.mRNA.1.CDS.1 [Saccharomyces cerevisiae]|nr:AIG_G0039240.mRNA.1.CDS.1 [Saccharomyces cerevisiae]CAI6490927.1 ALI_HP1_G0019120.mRNA.1.CDS.1 [Saccharomyces cerevisiae]CAI6826926.1 AIG_G0039240.mRNA.1.CDS.1 [Saccharomyces cerevisiae]